MNKLSRFRMTEKCDLSVGNLMAVFVLRDYWISVVMETIVLSIQKVNWQRIIRLYLILREIGGTNISPLYEPKNSKWLVLAPKHFI